MGRLLVGLLLVAALAGLCWLWREEGRAVAGKAALAEDAAERAVPELVSPASSADPASSATPERREREPGSPTEDRSEDQSNDDVRVVVVDPSGKPQAGIRLRLQRGANDPDRSSVPGPLVTDGAGRARFTGVRRVLESAVEPWTLRHDLAFLETTGLMLDRVTLAGPEVVSVLPSGGALEVVVRELDGSAAPEGSTLELRLVRDEDLLNPVLSGHEWSAELRAGVARFPWVELGRTWELSALRPEGTAPSRKRARGPSVAGESVRVEIELGADHPVVSFRAVDGDGKPLASAGIVLTRRQMFGLADSSYETDAEGRFTIDGEATPFGTGDFLVTHRPAAGRALQGRGSLPDSPKVGWNDGGDIVLESEPVLCAGRVSDGNGKPVPGADIVAGGDDQGWRSRFARSIRDTSDEQGRFELRGLWDEDEFQLHAEQHWPRSDTTRLSRGPWNEAEPMSHAEQHPLRSDTLRVRQGQRDVELVLSRWYTLSGRLLVEPGIDPRAVQFHLMRSRGGPVSADRRTLPDDDGGARFALRPVPAGEYELSCFLENLELARVERLSVHDDTDVGSIDLRGRVQVCEIVFVGVEEPARVGGEIVWKPHGSEERKGRIDGNRVQIFTPTVPIDVELRPHGYRHVQLKDVSGRRELVLEPALQVRLVLQTDGEFPELPHLLGCHLSRGDVNVGEPRGMRYFTRESREIELLVSSAGKLRVFWDLERRFESVGFDGAMRTGVLQGHEAEIEVLDVPGEQVFQVRIDGAALTALARNPPSR